MRSFLIFVAAALLVSLAYAQRDYCNSGRYWTQVYDRESCRYTCYPIGGWRGCSGGWHEEITSGTRSCVPDQFGYGSQCFNGDSGIAPPPRPHGWRRRR